MMFWVSVLTTLCPALHPEEFILCLFYFSLKFYSFTFKSLVHFELNLE